MKHKWHYTHIDYCSFSLPPLDQSWKVCALTCNDHELGSILGMVIRKCCLQHNTPECKWSSPRKSRSPPKTSTSSTFRTHVRKQNALARTREVQRSTLSDSVSTRRKLWIAALVSNGQESSEIHRITWGILSGLEARIPVSWSEFCVGASRWSSIQGFDDAPAFRDYVHPPPAIGSWLCDDST